MKSDLAKELLDALKVVLSSGSYSLHEPLFNGNEWKYLKHCLDSNYVSSVGQYVDRFETDLINFTGSKYAIAVVNGTSALHISLLLSGVRPEDEVLLPALTFVATANAIAYCGAIPHFVDSEEITLGIDANKLRHYLSEITEQKSGQCVNSKTGRIVRALIPMHTFGHPSDLEGLLNICQEFNLKMVEDAAEAIGSYYKGQHVGTFGLFGTLSFNGNKTITTGGGGAILTNNHELAKQAKHLTTTAKIPHKWEFKHDQVGFNYRMPNINAALGCAQLEDLPQKLLLKRDLFTKYKKAFKNLAGVDLFQEPENCKSNYWLQTLLLEENKSNNLQRILESTNESKIMTRPAWVLLNELKPFLDCPSMHSVTAKSLSSRIINIPSSSNLGNL
jgi:aminotransferase in exopolysaccharide biosynthesis